jgi:hypothetical protein
MVIAVLSDVSANELLEARLQRQLSEMAHVARLSRAWQRWANWPPSWRTS